MTLRDALFHRLVGDFPNVDADRALWLINQLVERYKEAPEETSAAFPLLFRHGLLVDVSI